MKDIKYEDVPKKISYHLDALNPPNNLHYHELDENGQKQIFSLDWVQNLEFVKDKNSILVQLAMSDGSVKELFGGSGYFSCNLDFYQGIDLKSIRFNKYTPNKINATNGISDYCYGSSSVALRSSIEHCELNGFIKCMEGVWRHIYDINEKNENKES